MSLSASLHTYRLAGKTVPDPEGCTDRMISRLDLATMLLFAKNNNSHHTQKYKPLEDLVMEHCLRVTIDNYILSMVV